MGVLYACKGAHTLFTGQREREREGERGKEREREGKRGREIKRCKICIELLFLFLKGMMGALAPFSYLVYECLYWQFHKSFLGLKFISLGSSLSQTSRQYTHRSVIYPQKVL